jgi:hypothetical protein
MNIWNYALSWGAGRYKLIQHSAVMVVKWLEGSLAEPRVKCSNPAEYFEKFGC